MYKIFFIKNLACDFGDFEDPLNQSGQFRYARLGPWIKTLSSHHLSGIGTHTPAPWAHRLSQDKSPSSKSASPAIEIKRASSNSILSFRSTLRALLTQLWGTQGTCLEDAGHTHQLTRCTVLTLPRVTAAGHVSGWGARILQEEVSPWGRSPCGGSSWLPGHWGPGAESGPQGPCQIASGHACILTQGLVAMRARCRWLGLAHEDKLHVYIPQCLCKAI